jgi:phosphoribosylformylglycinamidine synthase
MGEFVECVRAIGWMAKGTGIPCVSGNVSFYNETPYGSVAPTPTLLGIGIVEDVRKAVESYFRGGAVILVGETRPEFGGSLYSNVTGMKSYRVPRTSPERLKKYVNGILDSFKKFDVQACHDVAEGGIAVAIAEMSFGKGVGFSSLRRFDFVELFSESNTRWIVEVRKSDAESYVEHLRLMGLKAELIGFSEGELLDFGIFKVELADADNSWRNGMIRYLV